MVDDLKKQLEEDLQLLSDQLSSEGPLPLAAIRVTASAICRKWLLDRNLVKLCQSLGMIPTLPALDTDAHQEFIRKDGGFNFYTAGGVSIDGRPINSIYAHRENRPAGSPPLLSVPSIRKYTVSKFLKRKTTFIEGVWLNNEDILRYMSNKAGGIHYDTTRDKLVDRSIDRAKECLWLGDIPPEPWPAGLEVYLQLPKKTGAHWNCTHIEVCAIAQSLLGLHLNGNPLVTHLDT